MTKVELIAAVTEKTGMSKKDADRAVSAVIDAIAEGLERGDKVQMVGFGTFEVRTRAAREARNPQNGQPIRIPETKVPVFKAGKTLKERVK